MTICNLVVPPGGIHSGSRILAPYGQTMTMTMTMTNYGDPFSTVKFEFVNNAGLSISNLEISNSQ
jgi:hypothetical protein